MATNNNGNLLDTSGNVFVDFVWGNFAPQPNDERADGTPTATTAYDASQNKQWTTKTTIASARLNPTLGNHADFEAEWSGYPSFTANSAGKKSGGVYYISVPNVLGLTTALALDALKDAGYEAANITTATAATNAGATITAAARTAGSAVISLTCASHGFVAGNKVTVSDVSGGDGVNGSWTVLAVTNANVFTVTGTATTVQALTSLAGVVSGVAGTIKTQSVAAGGATIAIGQAVTITPWATAS